MNCEDVRKYEYTYLDGEFDERDRVEFEGHLGACAPCCERIQQVARVRDRVRQGLRAHSVSAPCDLQARIHSRLCREERQRAGRLPLAVPLALAASLAALGVGWQVMVPAETDEVRVMAAAAAPVAVRGSDPKRIDRPKRLARGHGPALRVTRSLRDDVEFCEPDLHAAPKAVARTRARGDRGELKQVADRGRGRIHTEVIGGGVGDDFLANDEDYGAIRSKSSLRAMVAIHSQPMPPEVSGSTKRIRRWLNRRVPGHAAPPIAEGAGVELKGARLGHLSGRQVVVYTYVAFGKPVTVLRYLPRSRAAFAAAEERMPGEGHDAPAGAVRDLVAGYSLVHTRRDGQILSIISELEHAALMGIIEPPRFL